MIFIEKWYLVHDGSKVIAKGFHTGEVSSLNIIEKFDTEESLDTRIVDLGLIDIVES